MGSNESKPGLLCWSSHDDSLSNKGETKMKSTYYKMYSSDKTGEHNLIRDYNATMQKAFDPFSQLFSHPDICAKMISHNEKVVLIKNHLENFTIEDLFKLTEGEFQPPETSYLAKPNYIFLENKGTGEKFYGDPEYKNPELKIGWLIDPQGNEMIGYFESGKFVCGRKIFSNGDVYIGQLNNQGVFHGKGVHYPNYFQNIGLNISKENLFFVKHYNGQWENGKKNGYGWEILHENGDYEGNFVNNIRHGAGKKNFIDLKTNISWTYEGEFDNGDMVGFGILRNSDYKYTGSVLNGEMNGNGTLIDKKSGDSYVGEFLNSQKNGPGVLIKRKGSKVKEVWKEGVFQNNDSNL